MFSNRRYLTSTGQVSVLHLVPHLKNIGNGIVNSTVDLAAEQAKNGMTVTVLARDGEFGVVLREAGVACYSMDRGIRSFIQIRSLVRRIRPDIVHCHTPRLLLSVRALFPFRKLVATAHNEFSRTKYFLLFANKIIAVSDQNGNSIARWAGKRRVRVVKNGIVGGIRSQNCDMTPVVALEHPALLFVGGLYERKGLAELLHAFKKLIDQSNNRPTLYILGAGPDRAHFERLSADLYLGNSVKFVGFVKNAWDYMLAADIFVLPSREEPFGLVLGEARVAGCAVIGTAVGGIPELLEFGRAGILVDRGDIDALSDAMLMLVDNEKARLSWARKAAGNVDWLSIERTMKETDVVYSECGVPSAW